MLKQMILAMLLAILATMAPYVSAQTVEETRREALSRVLDGTGISIEWKHVSSANEKWGRDLPANKLEAAEELLTGLDFVMVYDDRGGVPVLETVIVIGKSKRNSNKAIETAKALISDRLVDDSASEKSDTISKDELALVAVKSNIYKSRLERMNAWGVEGFDAPSNQLERVALSVVDGESQTDVNNFSAGLPELYREKEQGDPQWYASHVQALTQQIAVRNLMVLSEQLKNAAR